MYVNSLVHILCKHTSLGVVALLCLVSITEHTCTCNCHLLNFIFALSFTVLQELFPYLLSGSCDMKWTHVT